MSCSPGSGASSSYCGSCCCTALHQGQQAGGAFRPYAGAYVREDRLADYWWTVPAVILAVLLAFAAYHACGRPEPQPQLVASYGVASRPDRAWPPYELHSLIRPRVPPYELRYLNRSRLPEETQQSVPWEPREKEEMYDLPPSGPRPPATEDGYVQGTYAHGDGYAQGGGGGGGGGGEGGVPWRALYDVRVREGPAIDAPPVGDWMVRMGEVFQVAEEFRAKHEGQKKRKYLRIAGTQGWVLNLDPETGTPLAEKA